MQIDHSTLYDLTIFHPDDSQSLFKHLNHTQTVNGRIFLSHILSHPLSYVKEITDVQHTLQHLQKITDKLPQTITNGTLMVIEKFYESGLQTLPDNANIFNTFLYKLINKPDYSLAKYSISHFITFIKGIKEIEGLLSNTNSIQLNTWADKINLLLKPSNILSILNVGDTLTSTQILQYAFYLQKEYKNKCKELIDIYSKIDAYLSLAISGKMYNYCFPEFIDSEAPYIHIEGLYHPLLPLPVSYDTALNKEHNFLFLTGANMAGKSTLIKAIGISVYLAHIGMAVPAQNMRISYLDGLLSNIQVSDNIVKGESFFYNEVKRIKETIQKINDGHKWLILIDELFKGTNIQDAMKCSTVVIEGFCKMSKALFVLSTHLYEMGYNLKQHKNIQFRYFETSVEDGQLGFSYQLKEGISNDRLGYLIMEKEGVVKLLNEVK